MSESVETVKVIREDHPDKYVVINKADMAKDDILYSEDDQPKEGSKAWIVSELKRLGVDFDEKAAKNDLAILLEESKQAG